MIDGSRRVAFDDVEVVRDTSIMVTCRVVGKVIGVLPQWMLPGTTIARAADCGRLVLSREVALNLGLI